MLRCDVSLCASEVFLTNFQLVTGWVSLRREEKTVDVCPACADAIAAYITEYGLPELD